MKNYLSLFIITLFFSSCMNNESIYQPKEGDILLQDLECGPLCSAIKQVTFGVDSAEFSHIGLVQKVKGKWMVLEAISDGVKYTPLFDFVGRSLDAQERPKIWVANVKPEYTDVVKEVSRSVKNYIGKPYDDAFLMDNDKYYCSELIYEIFKKANGGEDFFELEPMTFKDPVSKEFLDTWKEYYQNLGMDIPEGHLGINPAGISRSSKIQIVKKLGKVSLKVKQ